MNTPDARRLRAALDARILNQSGSDDPNPLRRRFAYQRMLRRLADHTDGGWVLKGGYLLEARVSVRTRATKDVDLAMRTVGNGSDVVALLRSALTPDPDGDHFVFFVSEASALTVDSRANPAWRASVDAQLDGRSFAKLRVDLVERLDEIGNATEQFVIPAPVAGMNLGDAHILVVDIAQHAAEKFHALCQRFPDGRQNTRVKDLLDIVLLVESGLLPNPNLAARIRAVFDVRDGTVPPSTLPTPPASWRVDYALLANSTDATATDLDSAFRIATVLYQSTFRAQ